MSSEKDTFAEIAALRDMLAEQAERVGQLEGELAESRAELEDLQAELDGVCKHREALSKSCERYRSEQVRLTISEQAARSELARIRAERERAQARLCGHPAYGEGAVADGPGTPQASDLRELAEGVAGLAVTLARLAHDDDGDDGLGACFDAALERDKALGFALECGCRPGSCICYTRR